MSIAMPGEGLSVRQLQKSFGNHRVLKGIDLHFRAGEVHALLGPNGAGKSTLLSCLSGAVIPDAGEIEVGGRTYAGFTPKTAFEAGTAIIYQHFQLIGPLSVSDNMFLGSEIRTAIGTVNTTEQKRRSVEVLESLGVDIDPSRAVDTLSVGEQQVVEIARAVLKQPSVLILDEPTAALSEHEVSLLLDLVRRLAQDHGLTIIYVTHLLREVLEVADAVTVIRDGQVLWTQGIEDIALADLVHAIAPENDVQRKVLPSGQAQREDLGGVVDAGDALFVLEDYRSTRTGPVNVEMRQGEILGVYGLLGAGRTDFLEGLAGVRRSTGRATMAGRDIRADSPLQAQRQGVAFVASDRKAHSLFSGMTSQENLLVPHYRALSRPWRSRRREAAVFKQTAAKVNLVPADPQRDAGTLSGGNAQKLVVGRWLADVCDASLLLLDEPTQGVDIGARHELYTLIRAYASADRHAVIFATSDPEEVVALADRVIVLVDGAVADIVAADVGVEALLTLAHG